MDTRAVLEKVAGLVAPVLENLGYQLIERELINDSGRWVLRLYIDKEDGITIDDCTRASHGIEDLLEVEEAIPVVYSLEVSSPGLKRPLRRREDFEQFRGEQIRLKTLHPVEGRSNYKGTLEGIDGEDIVMIVGGTKCRVPYGELAKASVEPELAAHAKGRKQR